MVGSSVYAATYNAVDRFDLNLRRRRAVRIESPLRGLHEVYRGADDCLWVCATTIDTAIKVDPSSGAVSHVATPSSDPVVRAALGWEHLHLNAVAEWRGTAVALLSRPGAVLSLDNGSVVLSHPLLKRAHSLVVTGDSAFVCATPTRQIVEFDLPSSQVKRSVLLDDLPFVQGVNKSVPPGSKPLALPVFARGLTVEGDWLFVGISPAAVLCLDWTTGQMIDAYQYSTEIRDAIHGLCITS